MNIAITSSSNYNKYALTLIYFLAEQSQKPRYLVLIKEPLRKSLLRNIKLLGFKNTVIKIFRLLGYKVNVSNRDYLHEVAISANIKIPALSLPKACKKLNIEILYTKDINSPEAVKIIKSKEIDILINATGGIYKPPIINAFKVGILNAHMGLLPEFRGMNVLEWSLFYERPIGVTIHFIEKGIDTGDILLFKEISIEPGDQIVDLREKSSTTNVQLIIECINNLCQGRQKRIKQQPDEGKQYFTMHPRLKRHLEKKLQASHSKGLKLLMNFKIN